jgi:hypothetical protein
MPIINNQFVIFNIGILIIKRSEALTRNLREAATVLQQARARNRRSM